jgi:hypothetical protein
MVYEKFEGALAPIPLLELSELQKRELKNELEKLDFELNVCIFIRSTPF